MVQHRRIQGLSLKRARPSQCNESSFRIFRRLVTRVPQSREVEVTVKDAGASFPHPPTHPAVQEQEEARRVGGAATTPRCFLSCEQTNGTFSGTQILRAQPQIEQKRVTTETDTRFVMSSVTNEGSSLHR